MLSKLKFLGKFAEVLGPIIATYEAYTKFQEGDISGGIFKSLIAIASTVGLVGAAVIGGIPALIVGLTAIFADLAYEFVPWKKLGQSVSEWWRKSFGGEIAQENKPQIAALEKLSADNPSNQYLKEVTVLMKAGKVSSVEEALQSVKKEAEKTSLKEGAATRR